MKNRIYLILLIVFVVGEIACFMWFRVIPQSLDKEPETIDWEYTFNIPYSAENLRSVCDSIFAVGEMPISLSASQISQIDTILGFQPTDTIFLHYTHEQYKEIGNYTSLDIASYESSITIIDYEDTCIDSIKKSTIDYIPTYIVGKQNATIYDFDFINIRIGVRDDTIRTATSHMERF